MPPRHMLHDPPTGSGIKHYESVDEVPNHIKKYFQQRGIIFSKYNAGIRMTDSAWFGVTPEPIANKIATHVVEALPSSKTVIIDAFCGVGANAIAFALQDHFEHVFAIEKDQDVLQCAKHNAALYGVQNKIQWIQGDCFTQIKQRFDNDTWRGKVVIFASPPWGGPGYKDDEVFDLSSMLPYSVEDLYSRFSRITETMVLYLPRSSDLNQLANLVPEGKRVEVAHYCVKGVSKALCAYFGEFTF